MTRSFHNAPFMTTLFSILCHDVAREIAQYYKFLFIFRKVNVSLTDYIMQLRTQNGNYSCPSSMLAHIFGSLFLFLLRNLHISLKNAEIQKQTQGISWLCNFSSLCMQHNYLHVIKLLAKLARQKSQTRNLIASNS